MHGSQPTYRMHFLLTSYLLLFLLLLSILFLFFQVFFAYHHSTIYPVTFSLKLYFFLISIQSYCFSTCRHSNAYLYIPFVLLLIFLAYFLHHGFLPLDPCTNSSSWPYSLYCNLITFFALLAFFLPLKFLISVITAAHVFALGFLLTLDHLLFCIHLIFVSYS